MPKPTAKQKRILKRLADIQATAQAYALNPKQAEAKVSAQLAEEAANLGLELLDTEKEEEG